MPDQKLQALHGMLVDVGRLAPAHLPRTALHERSVEPALLKREIDIVRHEHLGGVRDRYGLMEELLQPLAASEHGLLERNDVEIEQPRVVRLDVDDLDIRPSTQLLEGVEHLRSPALRLEQKRVAESDRHLPAAPGEIGEH